MDIENTRIEGLSLFEFLMNKELFDAYVRFFSILGFLY